MPRVAIPLVIRDSDPPPLGSLSVDLPNGSGIGDLPWDLHLASESEELRLLNSNDQPAAIWFTVRTANDNEIRRESIPLLGSLHLLGKGVVPIAVAWTYKDSPDGPELEQVLPLRLQLLGRDNEFFLAAGINEDSMLTAHAKVTSALETGPWLQITLEHMLLALDMSGLSQGLLDLTICLESLLKVNAEVAFRFSHQICRLATSSPGEIEDYQALLYDLYQVRSTHVHGERPKRTRLRNVRERLTELQMIMRAAVVYAIEFHSQQDLGTQHWKGHLDGLLSGTAQRIRADWGSTP